MLLKLFGDYDVMSKVRSDGKQQVWSVLDSKPISKQTDAIEKLKRTLNADYGTGRGLEGVCELYLCTADGQKKGKINLDVAPNRQGVSGQVYCGKPPPPPPQPKPKPRAQVVEPAMPSPAYPPEPVDEYYGQQQQPPPPQQPVHSAPALVMAAPVAPTDWDRFIEFWEAQADKEMATL
eukprot:TRINITY_DN8065_c5_g1_i1.p1 TRINITY_DN8065_c5_g1~~TRINITY_DN8065_c5_g1_i1.p1  ORF type:complete len:207 (+),score=42.81 TRINITY_DN8065_c5_g1_i1:90-623(+)